MSNLRQAAQQALEALEKYSGALTHFNERIDHGPAITALKAALEQQAEPVAMRMPKVGDKVICLEDESFGEVVSLTAGGSPDISFDDGSRGTYMLREFAELFGYVAQPQRPWVGLTDEDFLEACQIAERGNYLLAFQRIQIKLKERNNG